MEFTVHHYIHADNDLVSVLREVSKEIRAMNEALQAKLEALTAEVTAVVDVETSAVTALNGVTAVIADLRDQLANAGATPEQLALIDDGVAKLEASKAGLAAAVAANTGGGQLPAPINPVATDQP